MCLGLLPALPGFSPPPLRQSVLKKSWGFAAAPVTAPSPVAKAGGGAAVELPGICHREGAVTAVAARLAWAVAVPPKLLFIADWRRSGDEKPDERAAGTDTLLVVLVSLASRSALELDALWAAGKRSRGLKPSSNQRKSEIKVLHTGSRCLSLVLFSRGKYTLAGTCCYLAVHAILYVPTGGSLAGSINTGLFTGHRCAPHGRAVWGGHLLTHQYDTLADGTTDSLQQQHFVSAAAAQHGKAKPTICHKGQTASQC